MRITGVFIAALLLVALLAHEQAAAQSDRKKAATPGNIVAPKGAVFAPSKAPRPSNNTAPRPVSNAPLTAAECKGLGGKVESGGLSCIGSGGGGQQCVTVDEHGVVRRKCLSKQ
jgi:hypothetical protein